MNLVIKPINNSNTDFGLSISSKVFNLELQDWDFAELLIDDDHFLRFGSFESHNSLTENISVLKSNSITGFIDLCNIQPFVISIQ